MWVASAEEMSKMLCDKRLHDESSLAASYRADSGRSDSRVRILLFEIRSSLKGNSTSFTREV